MKNMISALLSTTIMILAAAGHASAQGGDKDIAFIPAKNHAAYISYLTKNSNDEVAGKDTSAATSTSSGTSKAALKAVKANGKAVKNFNAIYKKEMPDANWSFGKDAIVATFKNDEVNTKVVYNGKGIWLHTLTYYPGNKTPKGIADIMDYAYPKDDVRLTVKVEEGGIEFYIVQLEGKTTFKKVTVYNGDVNEIEAFTKSN